MYLGCHCNINDYQLLENCSKDFILAINRDKFELNEVEIYLNTFEDFDFEISSKIRMYLNKLNVDRSKAISQINTLLEELKNNVLVDIREHN